MTPWGYIGGLQSILTESFSMYEKRTCDGGPGAESTLEDDRKNNGKTIT